jgi:hypothetical protein
MAFIPAAYGLRGLPGPTGRLVHRGVAWVAQHEPPLLAHGTPVQDALLLLPVGTPYHGTPKQYWIGKVQDVLPTILERGRETGNRKGLSSPD